MPRLNDDRLLTARIREWLPIALADGGERHVGCPACGRSFDLGPLLLANVEVPPLPCRCAGAVPIPFTVVPAVYGL